MEAQGHGDDADPAHGIAAARNDCGSQRARCGKAEWPQAVGQAADDAEHPSLQRADAAFDDCGTYAGPQFTNAAEMVGLQPEMAARSDWRSEPIVAMTADGS